MIWGVSVPSEPPDKEPGKSQDWSVREGTPHFADEALPAGKQAYTDYRDHDRRLTREPVNEMARPVHVVDAIDRGQRVKVEKLPNGIYEARGA